MAQQILHAKLCVAIGFTAIPEIGHRDIGHMIMKTTGWNVSFLCLVASCTHCSFLVENQQISNTNWQPGSKFACFCVSWRGQKQ